MQTAKEVIREKIQHPETGKPLNDVVVDGVRYRWNETYKQYKAVDGNGREADIFGILCRQVEVLEIDYASSE